MPKILPIEKQALIYEGAKRFFTEDTLRVTELSRALVLMSLPPLLDIQRSAVPFPKGIWGRLIHSSTPTLLLPEEASPSILRLLFLRALAHTLLEHVSENGQQFIDFSSASMRGSSTEVCDLEVRQHFPLWCELEPDEEALFGGSAPEPIVERDRIVAVHESDVGEALRRSLLKRLTPSTSLPRAPSAATQDAWLELTGDQSPRLELVMTGFAALPSAVEEVSIRWSGGQVHVLASNLRQGTTRIVIEPSDSTYVIDASPLAWPEPPRVSGLYSAVATIFRVRVDGEADRIEGKVVPRGVPIRLIVPPSLAHLSLPPGSTVLSHGWRVFSFELPPTPSFELDALLTSLGLVAGSRPLSVTLEGPPPVRWDVDGRGQPVSAFLSELPPILRIDAPGSPTMLQVVLVGESTDAAYNGSTGNGSVLLAIGDLPHGVYALEACLLVEGLRERRFFCVDESAPSVPRGAFLAHVGDESLRLTADETILDLDLSDAASHAFRLEAPAFWPVSVTWRTTRDEWLGEVLAGDDGSVPWQEIAALVSERCAWCPVGDLILDGKGLGRLRLRHHRSADIPQIVARLRSGIEERREVLPVLDGDCGLLLSVLLSPMAEALSYVVTEPTPWRGAAAVVLGSYRRENDRIVPAEPSLLVALPGGLPADAAPSTPTVERWRAALAASGFKRALLSSGLRWLVLDLSRAFIPPIVDLSPVLQGDSTPLRRLVELAHA